MNRCFLGSSIFLLASEAYSQALDLSTQAFVKVSPAIQSPPGFEFIDQDLIRILSDKWPKLIPAIIALQFGLRVLAEGALRVSAATGHFEGKAWAEKLSHLSFKIGQALAYFAPGIPKDLLIAKAEKLATKKIEEVSGKVKGHSKDGMVSKAAEIVEKEVKEIIATAAEKEVLAQKNQYRPHDEQGQ